MGELHFNVDIEMINILLESDLFYGNLENAYNMIKERYILSKKIEEAKIKYEASYNSDTLFISQKTILLEKRLSKLSKKLNSLYYVFNNNLNVFIDHLFTHDKIIYIQEDIHIRKSQKNANDKVEMIKFQSEIQNLDEFDRSLSTIYKKIKKQDNNRIMGYYRSFLFSMYVIFYKGQYLKDLYNVIETCKSSKDVYDLIDVLETLLKCEIDNILLMYNKKESHEKIIGQLLIKVNDIDTQNFIISKLRYILDNIDLADEGLIDKFINLFIAPHDYSRVRDKDLNINLHYGYLYKILNYCNETDLLPEFKYIIFHQKNAINIGNLSKFLDYNFLK